MAGRTAAEQSRPATLTPQQIRPAIALLEKRIAELGRLDLFSIYGNDADNTVRSLEQKVDDSLFRVFGPGTIEYNRYIIKDWLCWQSVIYSPDTTFGKRLPAIRVKVGSVLSSLRSCVELLAERLGDGAVDGMPGAIRAYDGLELHPEIARVASQLFKDGHFANAVEAAVKRLNGLVRMRSELEQDGSTLMERAFNPTNSVLTFNALADQSDKDEQRGFMMLFSGAVAGLRNPRAHGFVQDDPERALEFIAFVSLLAKLLDEATERRSPQ